MTTERVLDDLVRREGGFVDHPADRGGPTKYGITAKTLGDWRRLGRPATRAEVAALELPEARAILSARYLKPFEMVPFDALKAQLIDFGVTSGPVEAIRELQGVLGVPVDGVIGDRTRGAIAVLPWTLVNNSLVAARVRFDAAIAEDDATQRQFLRGWVNRAVSFLATVLLSLAAVRGASAQALPFDHLTPSLPTAAERHAADVASWVTVSAAVALDVHATWNTHCQGSGDTCEGALVRSGLRVGTTYGAVFLIKALVHRQRPCGDACGIDNEYASFYSAHTALAFSTLGGARLSVSLPLAVGTGGLRVAAGKHWLTDVLTGAAVGAITSRIR